MSPFPLRRAVALTSAFLASTALAATPVHPKFGFPVYTNKPAGRQLSGQHVPALTPALSPAEAAKKFTLPDGYEMRLFASEPDVVNPVAMTWDDRGRLWVVELYEYPLGAKPGEKGRDRIKILEDTDGDGVADSVKVFADGLNLATGILVANDGVYVGQAPHLYFMQDTNGDDVADTRQVVQTGFGLEDRHELLNGFTWGPDGQMYMTHGVFTRTQAVDPDKPGAAPVALTAGVARFNPANRRLEVFAEGTSNPWGVDFDAAGNAFVSACVIDHLFHLVPGGVYARQAGQPPNPYTYGLLPSIVDHRHHMAAYAGVCIYQGDQFPPEMRGAALEGNIHDNSIHWDKLTPKGASFTASFVRDFVRANDGWFMPVSTQVGPDGAVWIMDWYDRYPCYQNAGADPEGVDRERGRIWRVVWTGGQPGKPVPPRPAGLHLSQRSSPELVATLSHPNVWHRRMAQRILNGRRDASTKPLLVDLLARGSTQESKLAALWTSYSSGLIDDAMLDQAAGDPDPSVRAWAMRFTGERQSDTADARRRLTAGMADPNPGVRLGAAVGLRLFTSGSLTVDTPVADASRLAEWGNLIPDMLHGSRDAADPVVNFLAWMAAEPVIARNMEIAASWFTNHGMDNMPISGLILKKAMRRWCDTRNLANLDAIVRFLSGLPESANPLLADGLDGLIEGQRGKALLPSVPTQPLIDKLLASSNPAIVSRAQQLGAAWGDAMALKGLLASIQDPSRTDADRLKSIQAARQSKTEDARITFLAVAASNAPDAVKVEAIRALGEVGNDASAEQLVRSWPALRPAPRRAAAEVLTSKGAWTGMLLGAIERRRIVRDDIPTTVIRNLVGSRNDDVRNRARTLFGRVNASSAEKLKLIAQKRRMVVEGPVDLEEGHKVAQKACLVCHKLHGEGADVGPDLTGVGRSSLEALLHNVVNPNEIIGQGYENVEVETRDGRTVSGRLMENTEARVRLLLAGPQEEIFSKADVKAVRVGDNSVMPEGLEQMPDQDFRNLIWYILAPPQDGKPLTPDRKKELIGASPDSAAVAPGTDGESIALWNPAWRVTATPFEGAPARFTEWAGERNVLMTRPAGPGSPAVLEHALDVAPGEKTKLTFRVAARDEDAWILRVLANGRLLHTRKVGRDATPWSTVSVDLTAFAGVRTELRLENQAAEGSGSHAYWSRIELQGGGTSGEARTGGTTAGILGRGVPSPGRP